MKHMLDQSRLYLAETLIRWAMSIAPTDHPDTKAIIEAGLHVFQRRPH